MAITLPSSLSRDWTALKLWNVAARDFPKDALDTLFVDEWKSLMNRALADAKQKFAPIFGQQYMTRALLTQVDGEIDLSALRIDVSDIRRLKLNATIANVMTLSDLINLNTVGFEQEVIVGEQWIGVPQQILGNYIIDRIDIDGNPTGWNILAVEPTRFKLNSLVAGKAKIEFGKVGSKLSGATIVDANAYVQPIKFRLKVSLSTGSNTVTLTHSGNPVTMVGDYEINGMFTGGIGIEIKEYNPTNLVIDSLGSTTLEAEVRGNAIYGGTIVNLYEQRFKQSLTAGANVITFSPAMPTDYDILTDYTYNASGGVVGYTIDARSLSSITITPLEACTMMLRIGEVGVVYETLPIAPSSGVRTVLTETKEEFDSFRTSSKHNERTVAYWLGGGDRIELKKGYGLSNWQSFILHYSRMPFLVTATTDKPDLPDGVAMEWLLLDLKQKIAERCGLMKLIEGVPQVKAAMEREEFARAGITLKTETVKQQNLRITQ